MKMKLLGVLFVISNCLLSTSLGIAASQLDSLTIGYSSFSADYVPLWTAVEDRLGKKYGLDLNAVYAGRIRPQQLLASGETPFVLATGTGAITSHILGVKDQVIILTLVNKVGGAIVSKPEIKTPEDLNGKVIGTGRPGALAETIVRYVLRAKLGLVPDRDVKLLPVGEPQLALQGLERGIVDAASFSMPAMLIAKKKGFRELVSYEKIGIVYPYNTVTTLRQTTGKNPELVDRFLKIIIEGISIFKSNKERSLAIMRKYLRGADNDILEETYQYTSNELEQVPLPSLAVIKSALEMLSLQYPQAKQTDPNLIIDPSFVKKIEESGFIRGLYKRP
jgi:ABC-type nitrate/sulfonate/bicarbonate transport system substrate-binding protein